MPGPPAQQSWASAGGMTSRSKQAWREDTVGGLDQGSPVWVKHGSRKWRAATLLASHSKTCVVALDTHKGAQATEVRQAGS